MTVLLSYSINSLGSDCCSSPLRGAKNDKDSTLIAIDDLRAAVSKMTELKYLKQIDAKKDSIIANKDIQIESYKAINKKYKKQRNIANSISIGSLITALIVLICK